MKKKRGRPQIDEHYIFDNEKYLRIIFLIHTCETYKRNPLYKHLKYALVKNLYIASYEIREIKNFFNVASTDIVREYENLHYFTIISGDGHEHDLSFFPKKFKKDIIIQSLEFIGIFKDIGNSKKFAHGELSFLELLTELSKLTPENLIKKPFENANDLSKYMFNLKKVNLLETNGLKRNASYKLTKKGRQYLKFMHYENLKFLLINNITHSHGALIESNFGKIKELIETPIIPENLLE